MKKNPVMLTAFFLIVLTAFIGCGGKEKAASEQTPAQLRFSWWGNDARHTATIAVIDQYTAKHPNVTIDPEYRGMSERQKIATELAGGTVADLVQLNPPWMGDFTTGVDFFVDLGQKSDILDISGFDKSFLEETSYFNGKLIALPMGVNSRTTVINKTLAQRFNIPTSMDTVWTWEDFRRIGKTVNAQDPTCYFLNCDTPDLLEFVLRPYIIQKTGEQLIKDDHTLGFTRADLVEALAYIGSLFTEKVAVPAAEGNVFMNSVWTNPGWINGKMVLEFSWTSLYSTLTGDSKDEMGTFIMPIHRNAKDTGIIVTPSQLLSVSNKSKSIDEAVRFMNYFLNDVEAGKILGQVRSMPPSAPVRNACMQAGLIDQNVVTATDFAQKNRGLTPNTISTNAEITQTLKDAVEKVSYNPSQVEAAADQAIKLIENILKGLK